MDRYSFTVAGVTFENRQGMLHDLRKKQYRTPRHALKMFARLVRDKANPYDANAIKVLVCFSTDKGNSYKWYPIGYVPRHLAQDLAPRLDAGEKPTYTGMSLIGGTPGKNLGCALDIRFA